MYLDNSHHWLLYGLNTSGRLRATGTREKHLLPRRCNGHALYTPGRTAVGRSAVIVFDWSIIITTDRTECPAGRGRSGGDGFDFNCAAPRRSFLRARPRPPRSPITFFSTPRRSACTVRWEKKKRNETKYVLFFSSNNITVVPRTSATPEVLHAHGYKIKIRTYRFLNDWKKKKKCKPTALRARNILEAHASR